MKSPEQTPPVEQKCPNCGTMAPLGFALCPRCGMQLNAPSKTIYGCAILLFQGFLGLLALIFGACGACFTLVSFSEGRNASGPFLTGAVLLGLTYACIRGIIRIGKSRK